MKDSNTVMKKGTSNGNCKQMENFNHIEIFEVKPSNGKQITTKNLKILYNLAAEGKYYNHNILSFIK